MELLIVERRSVTKYLRYQYGLTQVNPSVTIHLFNTNKHQLILAKFHVNNALLISNQSAKFSVKSAKGNSSYSGFCEVTPNHFSFRSDIIHRLKLK